MTERVPGDYGDKSKITPEHGCTGCMAAWLASGTRHTSIGVGWPSLTGVLERRMLQVVHRLNSGAVGSDRGGSLITMNRGDYWRDDPLDEIGGVGAHRGEGGKRKHLLRCVGSSQEPEAG